MIVLKLPFTLYISYLSSKIYLEHNLITWSSKHNYFNVGLSIAWLLRIFYLDWSLYRTWIIGLWLSLLSKGNWGPDKDETCHHVSLHCCRLLLCWLIYSVGIFMVYSKLIQRYIWNLDDVSNISAWWVGTGATPNAGTKSVQLSRV